MYYDHLLSRTIRPRVVTTNYTNKRREEVTTVYGRSTEKRYIISYRTFSKTLFTDNKIYTELIVK